MSQVEWMNKNILFPFSFLLADIRRHSEQSFIGMTQIFLLRLSFERNKIHTFDSIKDFHAKDPLLMIASLNILFLLSHRNKFPSFSNFSEEDILAVDLFLWTWMKFFWCISSWWVDEEEKKNILARLISYFDAWFLS